MPTPSECRARVLDGDVRDALFVEEAAKLEVDLARGEVVRVEGRLPVLDLRRARRLGVGLGEPARVVGDPVRLPHQHLAFVGVVRVDLAVEHGADRDLLGGERDDVVRP